MLNTENELKKNECENTTKKWVKTCPKCNRLQVYSSRRSLWNAKSINRQCARCANFGKNNPFYGKTHTGFHKKSLSEKQKNCSYRYKNTTGKSPDKVELLCRNCEKKFYVNLGRSKSAKYCCYECAVKDNFGLEYGKMTVPEKKFEQLLINIEEPYQYSYYLGGKLYDFYIPRKHLLVEIDGIYWHAKGLSENELDDIQQKCRINDIKKVDIARKMGYNLLRIWEDEIDISNVQKYIHR